MRLGYYTDYNEILLYIKDVIKQLKLKSDINIVVDDDLIRGDKFVIGLIYKIKDTRQKLVYIGSEQIANKKRQQEHIPIAIYRFNRQKRLNKFQKHIINNKYNLHIFIDKTIEIVVYKNIEKLYEREQYYIDLYDSLKNGLNNKRAKIIDKIENDKIRFIEYDNKHKLFRKYGRKLNERKEFYNMIYETNLSYTDFKTMLEKYKDLISLFINDYCYDKTRENQKYNVLLNYILYEQQKRNDTYFYETYDDYMYDNNIVIVDILGDDDDNIIIDIVDDIVNIEYIDDIINIEFIDDNNIIIDII